MKKREFDNRILNSKKPVILDFWAPWCAPCRMMKPALKQVSKEYQSQVEVIEINADESRDILAGLKITSIPTLVAFSGGREIMRRSGVQSVQMLEMVFKAAWEGRKPAIIPPTPIQRFIRAGLGLGLAAIGWFSFDSLWLAAIGAVLVFSAFYDRCPIYKAVAPWLVGKFRRDMKTMDG